MGPKVPRDHGRIEGIVEPCPWYSGLSGITQGHRCPCPLHPTDTLIAVGDFLRKSSTLLWVGQHQCQFRYLRVIYSFQYQMVQRGFAIVVVIYSLDSHCPVGLLTHIRGGKAREASAASSEIRTSESIRVAPLDGEPKRGQSFRQADLVPLE